VPEWRREVTERLESYRSRRERQARQSGTNQSVLAFRVHSKSDTLEAAPEPELSAAAAAVAEPPIADTGAASAATIAAPGIETAPAAGRLGGPAESAAAPAPVAQSAAMNTAAAAIPKPHNGAEAQRTYQPIDETDLTADLTDITAEFSDSGKSAAIDSTDPSGPAAAESVEIPDALPVATEPAVVLADSATLEVHADPVELAEVQSVPPAPEPAALDSAPLASIPAIDTEYWHAAPEPQGEETECGSLTAGFESEAAAMEEETAHIEDAAEEEREQPELAPVAEAHSLAPAEEPPSAPHDAEEPAVAAPLEASGTSDSLFPDAVEAGDAEEIDQRRAALRTAARPLSWAAPERIEIRVPQPVFDFSASSAETQHPRDEALPVADLRERRCAATLDAAILGFTVAGFFLAFHLAGGEFAFSRVGIAVSVAATFLIYTQYVLLFTFVGGSTPGMVLRGLRVVCFDGKSPGSGELAWRTFGYLLSAAAGMIGFLWSAWDEHGLSWHDRISQTYITYAEPEVAPAILTTQ
jgi:uncharacterized RDD family membrane protein YckC